MPMKGKFFVDTNVLLYCYSVTEPEKKQKAIKVSKSENAFISTQVLSELCNILYKKFKLSWEDIESANLELIENFLVHINLPDTVIQACGLSDKYHFSFYDSLIIAAAIESGCSILYSEDLNHNQKIENKLLILNPFVE